MHPFISQALARQHQETLVREATYERLSRHLHKPTTWVPAQLVVLQQRPFPEPDFAEIRRDLHATLSEWCLESGTESFEAAIDTFMRCLRMRLGDNERCKETRALR